MKRMMIAIALLLALCGSTFAQEKRHEITVQGSGFFTKETTDLGVTSKPTYSGGILAGYRFNLNRWFGFEGDYDYFSNSQKYSASTGSSLLKTNVNAVTGTAVIKLPASMILKPYVLAGGGAIMFNPRDTNLVDTQARGTFVYGGGVDVPLTQHIAIRGQYRGFVYKAPDFDFPNLRTDKITHSAVPSAGLVFTF